MQFTTLLTSSLMAAIALANPIVHHPVASRDLCQVGVPCVVQYEVNVALDSMNSAVAMVHADVKAAAKPTGPVVVGIQTCANDLSQTAVELQAKIGPLSDDAKAELSAYVVAAISTLVGQIKTGVAVFTSLALNDAASVSVQVTEACNAVTDFIATIEAVVGPCAPATS